MNNYTNCNLKESSIFDNLEQKDWIADEAHTWTNPTGLSGTSRPKKLVGSRIVWVVVKPNKVPDPVFVVKIGPHIKHHLVLRIKSSVTGVALSGTELHPVEPVVQALNAIERIGHQININYLRQFIDIASVDYI
uniref:Uncharacterized protein n=1 Tax=Romanomermis culicivorax TaxID=13658 RepID=A0A915KYG9_ROMCU